MEWLRTGIPTLQEYINGYPKGRTTLIVGSPGAGKTIMALQFVDTCLKDGMKVVYIATEERPEDILEQAESIGLKNIKRHLDKNFIIQRVFEDRAEELKTFYIADYHKVARDFLILIRNVPPNTDVVVIDNLGVLSLGLTPAQFRDQFDLLIYILTQKGYTSMIISDISVDERISNVAMYSAYASIRMIKRENQYTGKIERIMDIVKIRNSPTPAEYLLYDITEKGIVISGKIRR